MTSDTGRVRDSDWHGSWTKDDSGIFEVSIGYRGATEKLISIHNPPFPGVGLRKVFLKRDGRLKAIVSRPRAWNYCIETGTWVGVPERVVE